MTSLAADASRACTRKYGRRRKYFYAWHDCMRAAHSDGIGAAGKRRLMYMQRRRFLHGLGDVLLAAQAADAAAVFTRAEPAPVDISGTTNELKIFLAGDVMTGRGVDQILPEAGEPTLHESWVRDARAYVELAERRHGAVDKPVAFDYIWGAALKVWKREQPDIRIVNLETSITASDEFWPGKGIHYRMHPGNVPCLARAGLDCCTLANNHVLDWGRQGLADTLRALSGAGINCAGAGLDAAEAARPARLTAGIRDVLVFACADESSGVPETWRARPGQGGVRLLESLSAGAARELAAEIARQRRHGDIVVVSVHWGGNWGHAIPAEQRAFARALIDEGGADIVHGHSSHHAKGIEIHAGKLILYGCGDFITDYEGISGHEQYRPWLSPMYFATLTADTATFQRLEIIPLALRKLRLNPAASKDRHWLATVMNRHGAQFGTLFDEEGDRLVLRNPTS